MTRTTDPVNSMPTLAEQAASMARWEQEQLAEQTKQARLAQEGRPTIFKWLTAHGVHHMVVPFSGENDCGSVQRDSIACYSSRYLTEKGVFQHESTLEVDIPDFVYDALDHIIYEGTEEWDWVNNEGGYGHVTFWCGAHPAADIPAESIKLEIHIRVISTEDHMKDL